jgi:hypothetical protein
MSSTLLRNVLPEFAAEVSGALEKRGEAGLARHIENLRILRFDIDGPADAVAIYTEPKPKAAYGSPLRNIQLDVPKGMVILDVVGERIASIEILGRGDIRAILRELAD